MKDVIGVGSYQFWLRSGGTLILHDVIYVPGIQHNLLSVVDMLGLGCTFSFSGNRNNF